MSPRWEEMLGEARGGLRATSLAEGIRAQVKARSEATVREDQPV